jgi:hypothetical protein
MSGIKLPVRECVMDAEAAFADATGRRVESYEIVAALNAAPRKVRVLSEAGKIALPIDLYEEDDGLFALDADGRNVSIEDAVCHLNAAPKRAFADLTVEALEEMRVTTLDVDCAKEGVTFNDTDTMEEYDKRHRKEALKKLLSRLQAFAAPVSETLEIGYTNYRGEWSMRRIRPVRLWVGSTDWHPEPGLLLEAIDLDKNETRHFAVKDFGPKRKAAPVASQASINALDDDSLYGLFVECGYVGDDPEAVATIMKEGIVRLLGEASPAPVAPAWQGIESAPKDTLVKVRPVREGSDAPYEFARLRPKNDPRWRAVTDNAPLRPTEWCAIEVAPVAPDAREIIAKAWSALTSDDILEKVPEIGLKAQREAENAEASTYAARLLTGGTSSRNLTLDAWAEAMREGFTDLLTQALAAPETQGEPEDV